jgi:hypothetical protein
MFALYQLLALCSVVPLVAGHGYVNNFITSSGTWSASNPYGEVNATSPFRKLIGYGPSTDFTSVNVTCGVRCAHFYSTVRIY